MLLSPRVRTRVLAAHSAGQRAKVAVAPIPSSLRPRDPALVPHTRLRGVRRRHRGRMDRRPHRPRLGRREPDSHQHRPVIDDDLTASMDSELLRHVAAAGPLHGLLNWQRASSTRHSRQRWRVWPARPVMPPCRRDSGQPGVRGIPRASGPRPAGPRHARAVGIVNDEIIAGQRENVPAMYPLRSSPPRASSNLLAALVRRLKRVCAPHANRAQGRPKTGIRLEPGVLNPC